MSAEKGELDLPIQFVKFQYCSPAAKLIQIVVLNASFSNLEWIVKCSRVFFTIVTTFHMILCNTTPPWYL